MTDIEKINMDRIINNHNKPYTLLGMGGYDTIKDDVFKVIELKFENNKPIYTILYGTKTNNLRQEISYDNLCEYKLKPQAGIKYIVDPINYIGYMSRDNRYKHTCIITNVLRRVGTIPGLTEMELTWDDGVINTYIFYRIKNRKLYHNKNKLSSKVSKEYRIFKSFEYVKYDKYDINAHMYNPNNYTIKIPEVHIIKWRMMLNRVYTEKAYRDVSICSEWYNLYNFSMFLLSFPKYAQHLYSLDKDLINYHINNKVFVYSPETCLLLPKFLNNLLNIGSHKIKQHPSGVVYNKSISRGTNKHSPITVELRCFGFKLTFGGNLKDDIDEWRDYYIIRNICKEYAVSKMISYLPDDILHNKIKIYCTRIHYIDNRPINSTNYVSDNDTLLFLKSKTQLLNEYDYFKLRDIFIKDNPDIFNKYITQIDNGIKKFINKYLDQIDQYIKLFDK